MEDLARQALALNDGLAFLPNLACLLTGVLLGFLLRRGARRPMNRVPYFMGVTFVTMMLSVSTYGGLFVLDAIEAELLWALLGGLFAASTLGGIAYGVLAQARSVDAFGDGRHAWMTLVPVLNLYLLAKRPLEPAPFRWTRAVQQTVGMMLGILMMFTWALLERNSSSFVDQTAATPLSPEAVRRELASGDTLETVLRRLAATVPERRLSATTTLLEAEAEGPRFRQVYLLHFDTYELPFNFQEFVDELNCRDPATRALLEAEATIEHQYFRTDGVEVGMVEVTLQNCDDAAGSIQVMTQPELQTIGTTTV